MSYARARAVYLAVVVPLLVAVALFAFRCDGGGRYQVTGTAGTYAVFLDSSRVKDGLLKEAAGHILLGVSEVGGHLVFAPAASLPSLAASDGGTISVAETTGANTANLSTTGTVDWVGGGNGNAYGFINGKRSGGRLIQYPIPTGNGDNASTVNPAGTCSGCPQQVTWTAADNAGTVNPATANPTYSLVLCNTTACAGTGWTLSVPAAPVQRVLRVYISGSGSAGFSCTGALASGASAAGANNLPGSGTIYLQSAFTFVGRDVSDRLVVQCTQTGTNGATGTGLAFFGASLGT